MGDHYSLYEAMKGHGLVVKWSKSNTMVFSI